MLFKLDEGLPSHFRWALTKELECQIHGHTKLPLKSVASKTQRMKSIDNRRAGIKWSFTADI